MQTSPTTARAFARGSRRELRRVAALLRTETVGGLVLVAAAVLALVWANSPWSGSYTALRDAVLRARLAPPAPHRRAVGRRRAARGLLLPHRARAQARVRGGRPALAVDRDRAGRRRRGRRPRTCPDLPRPQRRRSRRARLGDPGGHGHRVRPRRAGDHLVAPPCGAAHVPAHAGGGRRPHRDPRHRGRVHVLDQRRGPRAGGPPDRRVRRCSSSAGPRSSRPIGGRWW